LHANLTGSGAIVQQVLGVLLLNVYAGLVWDRLICLVGWLLTV
jgi:hypothetical protein